MMQEINSTITKLLIGLSIFLLAGTLCAQEIEQKISTRLRHFGSLSYQIRNEERQQKSTVRIKTTNESIFVGVLRILSDSTVQLFENSGFLHEFGVAELASISLVKQSAFYKNIGWGFGSGFAIGSAWGLLSPIGTEHDFTRGERFVAFGLGCGALGTLISGSYSVLKSVDIDIPWKTLSPHQQRALLSQIHTGTYKWGLRLRLSTIYGNISIPKSSKRLPNIEATTMIGVRTRLYFKPRAGIELVFAKTGWLNERSGFADPEQRNFFASRSRVDYFSTMLFAAFSDRKIVNPFVAWGVALVRETADGFQRLADDMQPGEFFEFQDPGSNTFLPVQIQIGGEIPITHWLSLDGRAGFLWYFWQGDGHLGYQLALNIGQKI